MEKMYDDMVGELRKEIATTDDYVKTLEAGINEWANKYADLEQKYHTDIPVVNDQVGFMSSIGAKDQPYAEEEEWEEEDKAEVSDRKPVGFKQTNIT